jgi:hypothetical protein
MGFLAKYWQFLLLLFLIAGLLLFVNKQTADAHGNVSLTPSFNPSLFPSASFSPSASPSGVKEFYQQVQLGAEGKSVVLRQELGPDGVEKTFLENYGLQQADFVLLKAVPANLSDAFGENWRQDNPDALTGEKLSDNVFKFKYSLASGGNTEFRLKSGKWGLSLVYRTGLFSQEQELRLAELLNKLAGLDLSSEELLAFQKIANGILSDESLSSEERLARLEALARAVELIHENSGASSGSANGANANAGVSDSTKARAIGEAGELLQSGGVPGLENGLDEIIDEMSDTRACERLPKTIELNVSRCIITSGLENGIVSQAFYASLATNSSNNLSVPCNPSSIELNFFKSGDLDEGALVSKFSESLGGLLNARVFQQDTVLNASIYVNLQKLNQTQPWPVLNVSADGFVYANVSKTNMTVPFLIDPNTEEGNTLLASLILSNSINFKNTSQLRCFNEYREQGKRLLTYYDKVLQNVSIALDPLSIKYNRGAVFSCTPDSCAMPSDSCALVGRKIAFNYDSQQPPGVASIKSGGAAQTETTYDLSLPNGGFEFAPAVAGEYELSLGGKTVSFEAKQALSDCVPESGLLPISKDCPPYLTRDGKLNASVILFEFNDSVNCNEGSYIGTFGRVVTLPCNANVRVCSHYYTLGDSANPGLGTPFTKCEEPDYYKALSVEDFVLEGRWVGYCAIRHCFLSDRKDAKTCHECFAEYGMDGGEKFEELQKMVYSHDLASGIDDEVTALCKLLSKPALYLYPESPLSGRVALETSELVVVSDPLISQNNDWNYNALPDGRIFVDGVEYPYLFYETSLMQPLESGKKGWIVERQNVEKWFFDMLPEMGLNSRETKDFTDYWVSRLPGAKFYEIKLIPKENVDEVVRVVFDPQPDVFIRVILSIKPTNSPALLEPPVLQTPVRKGFVAAEWGVVLEN